MPSIEFFNRRGLRQMELQGGLCRWLRQHFERYFGNQPQSAQRSGQQARHIITGHVFHHPPAEIQALAAAIQQLRTQHKILYRPRLRAARPGQTGRHTAAHGGMGAEKRRLKRQHLPAFVQGCGNIGQARAAAGGEHQLGGVIIHNTGVITGVQHGIEGRLFAVKILAAAAAYAQMQAVGGGIGNLLLPLLEHGVFLVLIWGFRQP